MNVKDVSGVVLAGGLGSRLGGEDKGLINICGRGMIEYVIDRFEPQVDNLFINANRNLERYAALGYSVVQDKRTDYAGPLAGMAAALEFCSTGYLATVPCDVPFLPENFVARLVHEMDSAAASIGVAVGAGRPQPAFTLISTKLLHSLTTFLEDGGRKISTWYRQQDYVEVNFEPADDGFANVNCPDDLAAARLRLTM